MLDLNEEKKANLCWAKKIFMPIVYGKTSYSASVDIQKKFIKLIGEDQASLNIAHICYHYWGVKYEKPDGFDSSY